MGSPSSRALARLARRAAHGDRACFGRLYEVLYPLVRGFVARRLVGGDIDELTARVFHRFLEQLHRYDECRGTVRAWVLTIARNAVIDEHRTARRVGGGDGWEQHLADPALNPCEQMLEDERAQAVRSVVKECDPEIREMLVLRFGDGLRHRDIAELLGLSEAAVKQRFSRALRDLRIAANGRLDANRKEAKGYATS